jgi:cell division protein YceG involved in septum cleavage
MRAHLALALAAALAACGGPAPDAPLEQVTIPPGATLRAISESLSVHNVLEHPKWFRILARIKGADRSAQAASMNCGTARRRRPARI